MGERIIFEIERDWVGRHCETSAIKTALEHHGLNLSEEMLFGLGGGISFIYWYMKMMPAPLIGGRNGKSEDFAGSICRRLGGDYSFVETASAAKGYAALKETLRSGDPAICYGDMAYLPYFGLPEEAHFGGHVYLVYGIDEDAGQAFIWDRSCRPFTVSLDDLARARGSKFQPFPPKHRLLKIEYPDRLPDLRQPIREAIQSAVVSLTQPPIKNFGLSGMLKWAGLLPKWPREFQGMNLIGLLMNLFIYIETGGTGGSAFRKMYAEFLEEAAEINGQPELKAAAGLVRQAAEVWSRIAAAALPDDYPALGAMRRLILRQNEVMEQQAPGTPETIAELNREGEQLTHRALTELAQSPPDFLAQIAPLVRELHARETAAAQSLAAAVGQPI